jgi:hypothetical protein
MRRGSRSNWYTGSVCEVRIAKFQHIPVSRGSTPPKIPQAFQPVSMPVAAGKNIRWLSPMQQQVPSTVTSGLCHLFVLTRKRLGEPHAPLSTMRYTIGVEENCVRELSWLPELSKVCDSCFCPEAVTGCTHLREESLTAHPSPTEASVSTSAKS